MLNVICIQGRLTAEPELKSTPKGISVTRFTVAVERSYASGGERQTDFFDVVAWRHTADFANKYFDKGQMILVSGRLETRKWEDKSGNKRTSYEIVADSLHFCGGKQERESGGGRAWQEEPPRGKGNFDDSSPRYSSGAPEDFTVVEESEDLPF